MKRLIFAVCVLALIFAGCPPRYNLITVPEEAGARLEKITTPEDGLIQPAVTIVQGHISYTPREYFDVSRSGDKIAFIGRKNNSQNVFVRSLAGGNATLQRTFRDNITDAAFSPDGKTLAFTDYRDNNLNIYSINADSGAAIRQITTASSAEFYPVFSPDGATLLFLQSDTYNIGEQVAYRYFIWGYDMEKGSLTQYTEGFFPSFLPDSKRVVIQRKSRETGNAELWLVDLEKGQEFVLLSDKKKGYVQPAVSPDGTKVVFSSESSGRNIPLNGDIFMCDIDGTNLTQLTFHPGNDGCPRWSADGRSIFFLSQRGSARGEYNIWKMDIR
jgi:Tol biopolymer transport system component